ncbi:MAG: hypothetical protein PVJ84_17995 [Desulfobacteraceae bacterium]|jgi:hypothetical protein
MVQKQLTKQIIEFNQSSFNNSYQALALLQDQFERIANTVIDQANWLPAEGRKAIENWVEAYKTGRDDFKSFVDDSYKQVERFYTY